MFRKYVFPIVVILSIVLSACGEKATEAPPAVVEPTKAAVVEPTKAAVEEPTKAPVVEAPKYKQSPLFDAAVADGSLPPVEERLPDNPLVVTAGVYLSLENLPELKIGKYGGTLRLAHSVANWNPDAFVMVNEPFMIAQKIGVDNLQCNVCESFTVSDDNKVFTFTLRKGLKWSDGELVTTEDVRFTYEDIFNNEKLYPNGPSNHYRTGYTAEGGIAKLDIIDDYTFKYTFDGPYGSFVRAMTIEGWVGYSQFINPAHYLKQYHINYTTLEKLAPELTELNLTGGEWWQVFAAKRCQNWDQSNPRCAGYPGLYPWLVSDSGNPSLITWERNPYYFKVDAEGNQLPYIDKLASTQVNDMEAITLKIVAGDVDFQRESTALIKMPLYKQNEEKAGFRVQLLDMHVDSSSVRLNQTFKDDNWQSIVKDLRFRQAVSLAVNRQELIDTIYYGYAAFPLQTVGEEFSKYDVAKANALLDEMGLTEKDADGYRKYADGTTINMLLEQSNPAPDISAVSDLVAQYLKDVGLKVEVKLLEGALYGTKWAANEIAMTSHWSHDVGWGNDIGTGNIGRAGVLWSDWVNAHGATGEEPPQWIKDVIVIDAAKWAAVAGSDEYNKQVEAAYQWCRDNLPYINLVEQVQYPLIVNKNLQNVAIDGYAIATNFSVVQMFFDPVP